MKKPIVVIVLMLFALAACGGLETQSQNEPAEPIATPPPVVATTSPFDIYILAAQELDNADSLLLHTASISIMRFEDEFLEIGTIGTVAQVIHNPTNIDLKTDMILLMDDGIEHLQVSYFRNGRLYLVTGEGTGFVMSMPFEEVIEQYNVNLLEFGENAILDQSVRELVNGRELSFNLSTSVMSDLITPMIDAIQTIAFEGMSASELGIDIEFGDMDFVVGLDTNDSIRSVDMWFNMILSEGGEELITWDTDMRMEIIQVGGVTIEFPDYLDDFIVMD